MSNIVHATVEDLKPGNYFLWYGPNEKSYETLISDNTMSDSNVVGLVPHDIISESLIKYYVRITDETIISDYLSHKNNLK